MSLRHIPNGAVAGLVMEISANQGSSSVREIVEALYRERYDSLYGYLVLTGSSPSDADEFVQETFLRLLRTLQSGDGIRDPRPWLFRVAHNIRADWQRQSGRQTSIVEDEKPAVGTVDPVPDPEAQLLQQERAERLQTALAQLTQRQAEILHLRAEGLKLREIAELLGISLQSVSEACARAVDRVGRLVNE